MLRSKEPSIPGRLDLCFFRAAGLAALGALEAHPENTRMKNTVNEQTNNERIYSAKKEIQTTEGRSHVI